MGVEIERKFLVANDGWRSAADGGTVMKQGYLVADAGRTVRVRVAGMQAWLTIKGPADGPSRAEFEYAIGAQDAEDIMGLSLPEVVHKTRFRVPHGDHVWEVDIFDGQNAPLVLAEVEMSRVDEPVILPSWLGVEVTGDRRYSNSQLARQPFRRW